MHDPSPNLWLSQAESDRHASTRIFDPDDHRTFCQTISKHQQTVEKAVKAIAAAVSDAGILSLPRTHYYKHDVDVLVSLLGRLPKPKDSRDIQGRIDKLLNSFHRSEIKVLSALTPRKPAPGALHSRNIEYPYETAPGIWTAPTLIGSFQLTEVTRFNHLAERIYQGAQRLVSALQRR